MVLSFIKKILLVSLALLVAACGGSGGSLPPVAYNGQSAAPGARKSAAPASADYGAPRSAPTAEADSAGADDAEARADRKRPGLGTVWGENRTSEIRHVSFVRASSRPVDSLTLMYNDAAGVRAQMRYRGGEEFAPVHAEVPRGGLSVALVDSWGRVLKGRRAGGRTYVVGDSGDRYAIKVTNDTPVRFEVVASVDGLDVVDGRPASVSKRGYIVRPNDSITIEGFRRSDNTVAAFRFGKVKDSYATRTTGSRNVGVIGLAFFDEKDARWTPGQLERRETANPFPADNGYAQPPR